MTQASSVVLYVEDNVFVRESVAELLSEPQRRFISVGDGAGARAVLHGPVRIDLLLTDINLPDASGLDLAREARAMRPDMPIVVCSAHDLGEVAGVLGSGTHMLRKPFELEELEALLDRLLDRGA